MLKHSLIIYNFIVIDYEINKLRTSISAFHVKNNASSIYPAVINKHIYSYLINNIHIIQLKNYSLQVSTKSITFKMEHIHRPTLIAAVGRDINHGRGATTKTLLVLPPNY